MLVKQSIVEKWYQRDSWVYKNFAYLFQNPLWQKSIPRGFSVCPYFWLNIFSLFLFRPFFVAPIQFLILPTINAIGKPAHAIDRGLYRMLVKLGFAPLDRYSTGAGTGLSIAFTLLIGLVGFLLLQGGIGIVHFYPYISHSALGMFSFWSIASFISLWIIILLHQKLTRTDCKTINYLYIWLILFAIGIGMFIPSEFATGAAILFGSIGHVIALIATALWFVICFLAKWIWVGLKWKPVNALYIPWIGYLVGLTIVAWLSNKIMIKYEEKQFATFKAETTEEYWERNRRAWIALFTRTLLTSDYWNEGTVFEEDGNICDALKTSYAARAAALHRHTIYKKALETFFSDDLNKLQTNYPLINQNSWEDLRTVKDTEIRFAGLCNVVSNVSLEKTYTNYTFSKAIIEACNSPLIQAAIDNMAAIYKAEDERKLAKKEASKNSWSHMTCIKVTTALSNGFCWLGRKIKWSAVQFWTLLVYLWMLVKAKKQGACPYFQFSEGESKNNQQTS